MDVNQAGIDLGDLEVRPATHDDHDAVVEMTADIWRDRGSEDYIPHIYHDWIEGDGKETLVADAGDELAGIAQVVALSPYEAWCQGMRVNSTYRGAGVSTLVNDGLFEWARDRGAVVARNMVFSWNVGGLAASRGAGFAPTTEFRWAQPDPDPDADPALNVTDDVDAAWRFWTESDARDHLRGLALSLDESWALQELTREGLYRAADERRVFTVKDAGTRAMSYRVRDYTRPDEDGEPARWAEYGVAAWTDVDAARALRDAIARDAADLGAERVRILIPETARYVSDATYARMGTSENPDFVMAADLDAWTADRD